MQSSSKRASTKPIISLLFALALSIPSSAMAQPEPPDDSDAMPPPGPPSASGPGLRMRRPGGGGLGQFGGFGRGPLDLSVLNLSEDQKNKIKTMRQNTAGKAKNLKVAIKKSRGEMFDMMFDPETTDSALKAKHAEVRKLQGELGDLMIQDFLSIKGVLTGDQLKHLPELKPGGAHRQPIAGKSLTSKN